MKTFQLQITSCLISIHKEAPELTKDLTYEKEYNKQEATLHPVTSPAAQTSR